MAWHYSICPICKESTDDRGFCGCPPPFSLDAIPQEKLDGIARVMFPEMKSFFEEFYKVPGNIEKAEAWRREYHRRKAEGIKPTIPPFGWKDVVVGAKH
jgi:hypothetical protein